MSYWVDGWVDGELTTWIVVVNSCSVWATVLIDLLRRTQSSHWFVQTAHRSTCNEKHSINHFHRSSQCDIPATFNRVILLCVFPAEYKRPVLRESPSFARLVYPVCGAVGKTTADVVTLLVDIVPELIAFPAETGVVALGVFIVTTCPLVVVFWLDVDAAVFEWFPFRVTVDSTILAIFLLDVDATFGDWPISCDGEFNLTIVTPPFIWLISLFCDDVADDWLNFLFRIFVNYILANSFWDFSMSIVLP